MGVRAVRTEPLRGRSRLLWAQHSGCGVSARDWLHVFSRLRLPVRRRCMGRPLRVPNGRHRSWAVYFRVRAHLPRKRRRRPLVGLGRRCLRRAWRRKPLGRSWRRFPQRSLCWLCGTPWGTVGSGLPSSPSAGSRHLLQVDRACGGGQRGGSAAFIFFAGHVTVNPNNTAIPSTLFVGDGCLSFVLPTFTADLPTVYKHCPWRYGGPVGPADSNDAALLWAAPNTANGDPLFDGAVATVGGPSCALCERSPCSFATDCYEPNTAFMNTSAYFPNCKCTCKEGAWGDKCQWPLAEAHGGAYPSQYQYHCEEGAEWSHSDAAAVCARRGDGWALATFPEAASFYRFRRQVLHNASEGSFGQAWVGAFFNVAPQEASGSSNASTAWQWSAGRFAGSPFYRGASLAGGECVAPQTLLFGSAFSFTPPSCAWGIARPSAASATAAAGTCVSIDNQAKWRLGDRPCGAPLSCVACERTPCVSMAVDCIEANTRTHAGPNGFFPRCCVCKHGKTGYACHLDATATASVVAICHPFAVKKSFRE